MVVQTGVDGNDIKVRVEKVFATKELQPAIDTLEELLRHGIVELPCWMEGIIVERLRNVGIDIRKNGGWYRCVAAYTLLPKIEELLEFENKYTIPEEQDSSEDENLRAQWFEILNSSVSATINSICSEFNGMR